MQCPHCNQEHPNHLKVCPNTNLPLAPVATCPKCGREVRPGARFCAGCGQALPRQTAKLDPSIVKNFHDLQTSSAPGMNVASQTALEQPAAPSLTSAASEPAASPPDAPTPIGAAPQEPATAGDNSLPLGDVPLPIQTAPVSGLGEPIRAAAPPPAKVESEAGWVAIPTSPRSTVPPPETTRRPPTLIYLGIGGAIALVALFFIWRGLTASTPAVTPTPVSGIVNPLPTTAIPTATHPLPTATHPVLPTLPPPTKTSPPSPVPATPTEAATAAPLLTASPETPVIITPTLTTLESVEHELAFVSNRADGWRIYVMDPEKPGEWHVVPLPTDYELVSRPSFCDKRLAFEAEDRSLNLPRWIFLYDLAAQTVEPLQFKDRSPDRAYSPGCSPSGRYMAATIMRNGRWHLDVIDMEKSSIIIEQPTSGYPQFGFASWPTSEDYFIWMGSKDSGYFDINRTTNPGSGPARTFLMAQGRYPAISPDGTKLAFFCGNLSNLCMAEWPSVKLLFQIPISYFKLFNQKTVAATAAWSVNGEWVYFSSSINGNWDIYRMHPDGSQVQNLTEGSTADEIMPAAR